MNPPPYRSFKERGRFIESGAMVILLGAVLTFAGSLAYGSNSVVHNPYWSNIFGLAGVGIVCVGLVVAIIGFLREQ